MFLWKRQLPAKEAKAKFKEYFDEYIIGKQVNNGVAVKIENVDKVYENGIKALSNMSLDIKPGEFIVLLGPSGCGKSTLLRMIAGLESISAGYIKFNGAIMNSVQAKDRQIAMVFQNYALYSFMNVEKNISFGLKNKTTKNRAYVHNKLQISIAKNSNFEKMQAIKAKIAILKDGKKKDQILTLKRKIKIARIYRDKKESDKLSSELKLIQEQELNRKNDPSIIKQIKELKEQYKSLKASATRDSKRLAHLRNKRWEIINVWLQSIKHRISDVTKMLDMEMYTKRKPSELSGGQRQRVALARAISKSSGIFLFDEPLSNLDAKLRAKMRIEIKDIHNELGSTSIYVTHDQVEAMSMADKVVVMNHGYIQQIGTPLDLVNKPLNLFVAKFIGNTDINILPIKFTSSTEFMVGENGKTKIMKIVANSIRTSIPAQNDLVAAFRPEHAIVEPSLVRYAQSNKFKGVAIKTELLGNDVLVQVRCDEIGRTLGIVFPTSHNTQIGDHVEFVINPNKIHIYDNVTGFNIFEEFNQENIQSKENWLNGYDERVKNKKLLILQKNKLDIMSLIRLYLFSIVSKTNREIIKLRNQKVEVDGQYKAE